MPCMTLVWLQNDLFDYIHPFFALVDVVVVPVLFPATCLARKEAFLLLIVCTYTSTHTGKKEALLDHSLHTVLHHLRS